MQASTAKEQGVLEGLKTKFGELVEASPIKPRRLRITVGKEDIVEVALQLKRMGFDQAASVAGTDYPKENVFEVVYHAVCVGSEDLKNVVVALATRITKDDPTTPSLLNVWRSVEYHERETHEMLGIRFEGHPRLERLLLPEDWADIPPLRKEFRLPGR